MAEIKNIKFINKGTITNFSLRSAGILKTGDKYLLVKNEGKEKFKLPGGHLQISESFIDALKRELKEEINLEIDIDHNNYFFDQTIVEDLIIITCYFNLGEINQILENTNLEYKFFNLDELNRDNTYVSEIRAIKNIKV